MALNNLRIIHQNIADISSITASSVHGSATSALNLLKDIKSYRYKSAVSGTTSVKVNIVLTFPTQILNRGIGLIFTNTNLTNAATIRVRGYTGTAPLTGSGTAPTATLGGSQVFDSGVVLAAPYQNTGLSDWSSDTFNTGAEEFIKRKVYARVWVPLNVQISCSSILIEIEDNNQLKYFEASRIIFGSYWSPKFNTSYGLELQGKDLTTNFRTEAGDLLSNTQTYYNTLSFDIRWMYKEDRAFLNKIVRLNGISKPLFVSIFPSNTGDLEAEQVFQIYGKLTSIPNIEHSVYEMYSSQVEVEEI